MIARLGLRWPGGALRRKKYDVYFEIIFILMVIIINLAFHHSVARNTLRSCMNYCTRWASLARRGVCGGRTTIAFPIMLILL